MGGRSVTAWLRWWRTSGLSVLALRVRSVFYGASERRPTTAWQRPLAAALSLLAIFCGTACGTCPPAKPARPILVHSLRCLEVPPPSLPRVAAEGIREDGCPSEYVCLTRPAATELGSWMRAMWDWAQEAWARCGPIATGKDPGVKDG